MAEKSRFEYNGFREIDEKLKAISLEDPTLHEQIRKATWEVLAQVRRAVISNAKFKNSRHNSIASVRRSVFKKILGGSVSILDGKRRGNSKSFKTTGQSARTAQINSYSGKDRGFILRFVNSGTRERYASMGRNTHMSDDFIRKQRGRPGYRGDITSRNFFAPAANNSIQQAADELAELIEIEIQKQFNNG